MNLNINNDLSVEQKAFVDSARKFSKDNIAEKALEWDKNSFFPVICGTKSTFTCVINQDC